MIHKDEAIKKGVKIIDSKETHNPLFKNLKANFPQTIKDNQVDLKAIATLLGLDTKANIQGYELTFTGIIAEGYHGYPLSDMFSAPLFIFNNGETVGDMRETEPTHASVDEFGDTVNHYIGKMVFIQDIKAEAGTEIKGEINTNICTNETNRS